MDVERSDAFLPVIILTEDVEKIALMKAALRSFTNEHERALLSVQRRLKDGKKKIEFCTRESNAIQLELNALETKISETLLLTQESEIAALQTVKENRTIKRKIIALKNDIEEQDKLVKRAKETIKSVNKMYSMRNTNCIKLLPKAPT